MNISKKDGKILELVFIRFYKKKFKINYNLIKKLSYKLCQNGY